MSSVLAYAGSVKYGFSQDDWYFLYISVANNPLDVLNFFNPWSQSGFAFYRPLGTQLYYYLSRLTLGLDTAPLGMHIFMLVVQSISAFSVYKLIKKLTKNNLLSILTGLIYATSSVHFLSLYYIAATQQLLATMFALLATNDFLERKTLRSALWFALGLLCKEVAIVTPIIMILAELRVVGKLNFKKLVMDLIPIGLVGALYVFMRVFGGLQVQSEYQMVLSSSVVSTMRWYFLFGYGAPEELVRYGLPRMAVNFSRYIADYGWKGALTSLAPMSIVLYVIIRSILGLLNRLRLTRTSVGIYFAWWILALAPVLFLQDHRYPHYVDLALIPMILLAIENLKPRTQIIMASFIIFISLVSINLSELTHWTVKRAEMSNSAVRVIKERGSCNSSIWYVTGKNDSAKQLSYTLSLVNGPRVICNNPNLQVYYQGVSMGNIPSNSQIIGTAGISGL